METVNLRKFYLFSLVPILVLLGIISFVRIVPPIVIIATLVGYIWPLMFITPGAKEKFLVKKYKFSLVGVSYRYYDKWGNVIGHNKARVIFPFLFIVFLSILMRNYWVLFGLLGIVFFQLNYFFILRKKFSQDDYKILLESENEGTDYEDHSSVESHQRDND